ncbi:MAG: nucleotide exchange factor GrpE [Candidatus Riflebacteria bacterium]|nr:nucleotide exchange factor GrpE [Candidatus Riflebacteria bacterium]
MMPEANGEISNEFFKKLNQQIVQKDNLIKLLQLQIRNLKSQIEAGEADAEKSDDLQRVLEQKNSELEGLRGELEEQKKLCASIGAEKDEQIRSLNEMLEQSKNMTVAEYAEDPKITELEENIRKIQTDYQNAKAELDTLKIENISLSDSNTQLKNELESFKTEYEQSAQKISELNGMLEAKQAELQMTSNELKAKTAELESVPDQLNANAEQVQKALKEANEQNQAQLSQVSLEAEAYKNQVSELTRKVEELQIELAGKERGQISSDEELKKANEALVEAKNEIARLAGENDKVEDLEQQIEVLKNEKQEYTEIAMKLTVAEGDVEKLNEELERVRSELVTQTKKEEYVLQISQLQQTVVDKEDEIAVLRKALEARLSEGSSVPHEADEYESLTQQVADQLLTIQNFDKQLKMVRHQLNEKETELNILKNKIAEEKAVEKTDAPINFDNGDIIGSFIDFFDGLDTALSKKQDPELQALHKKLMDRLIIPNQISYMPVISEEYDVSKHIATDYFRSDRFPERCIVFEVEKGYKKGDAVIKKSKVWVVQNLFKCSSCGAEQTNPESRFCHLCGAKILAPNGLPIDSLPVFEPTAITFNRFSERMLEKGNLSKAKEYIEAGLQLDSNYVPLILSMADVLISESKFQEAVDYLKQAYDLKPDERTKLKIQNLETKLNIFSQAKNLKLSSDEFDKLLHIIQK